jgi:hypothetical protein
MRESIAHIAHTVLRVAEVVHGGGISRQALVRAAELKGGLRKEELTAVRDTLRGLNLLELPPDCVRTVLAMGSTVQTAIRRLDDVLQNTILEDTDVRDLNAHFLEIIAILREHCDRARESVPGWVPPTFGPMPPMRE